MCPSACCGFPDGRPNLLFCHDPCGCVHLAGVQDISEVLCLFNCIITTDLGVTAIDLVLNDRSRVNCIIKHDRNKSMRIGFACSSSHPGPGPGTIGSHLHLNTWSLFA